jgi:ribosome-binding protein aMBF1 (putative translation factor)
MIVTAETKTRRHRSRGPKERVNWESRPVDTLAARVGANLRRIRVAAGMTQEQFAAKTGLRQSAIAKIEASTTGRGMQTAKIAKLAELLRKKVDSRIAVTDLLN